MNFRKLRLDVLHEFRRAHKLQFAGGAAYRDLNRACPRNARMTFCIRDEVIDRKAALPFNERGGLRAARRKPRFSHGGCATR